MSKEKKHHLGMPDGFNPRDLFHGGDGNWIVHTPFGYVGTYYKDGKIIRVEIDGKPFVPAAGDDKDD